MPSMSGMIRSSRMRFGAVSLSSSNARAALPLSQIRTACKPEVAEHARDQLEHEVLVVQHQYPRNRCIHFGRPHLAALCLQPVQARDDRAKLKLEQRP